jgi:hypothetical protein
MGNINQIPNLSVTTACTENQRLRRLAVGVSRRIWVQTGQDGYSFRLEQDSGCDISVMTLSLAAASTPA